MSDAHNEHESVIRTPKQLIAAVVAGFFLITVIGIVLLVQFVTNNNADRRRLRRPDAGSHCRAHQARWPTKALRLRDVNAPKQSAGRRRRLHSRLRGLPRQRRRRRTEDWATPPAGRARIAPGLRYAGQACDRGIRAMPAKGGNPDLDDVEVARAVVSWRTSPAPSSRSRKRSRAGAAADAAAAAARCGGCRQRQRRLPAAPAAAAAPAPRRAAARGGRTGCRADAGKKAVRSACIACHGAGIAGAPKFGDKAAWATASSRATPCCTNMRSRASRARPA